MFAYRETALNMPPILQGEARKRFLQGIAFGAVATIAIGFIWAAGSLALLPPA